MKKVLKIFLLVLLIGIVISTLVFLAVKSKPKATAYEIVNIGKGDIQKTSVATGKVSPRDEILIKPQISGIISEVLKEAGDFVKVGDIIATVQVVPDVSQLNSAESRVKVAKINLKQIESTYNRQKQLFDRGVIAREEWEKSEAEYNKAKEELSNAEDNRDIVIKGISKNTAKYSNTQIRSTISGMILDVPIKVGNSVIQANTFNDGTTIASVADMNDLLFIGDIDETEVGRIKLGMPIKVSVGALQNQKFDGKLEYISPKGTEKNGAILFEIKAAVTIPDSVVIRAGYSANAEIILENVKDKLIIPESTVSFSNDSAFVYVVKDSVNHVYDKTHIKTGLSDGINVEVKSGLSENQKLRGNEVIKK